MLERNNLPPPPDLASPDEVAAVALERLPFGPIHNWGLGDDETGFAWASAAARRARVLEVDRANVAIFGAKLSG
jgi:hypothetical protein